MPRCRSRSNSSLLRSRVLRWRSRFVFAVVTNAYPFIAAAYVLDEETEAQACEEVTELLALYASCKKSGNWPAFGQGCNVIGLPAWARRSTEIEVAYA